MVISEDHKLKFKSLNLLAKIVPLSDSFIDEHTKKPIFIIGSQRSGTGFLMDLINQSTEVCNWSEANYVWEPGYYKLLGGTKESIPGYIGKGVHAHEIDNKNAVKKRVRKLFSIYSFLHKGKRLLHKNPFNSVRTDELVEFFPDCKIINMLRDVRAVVRSVIKKNQSYVDELDDISSFVDKVIYRWKLSRKRFLEINQKKPNQTIEISYSQLGSDNKFEIVEGLFNFLELEMEKGVSHSISKFENMNFKYERDLSDDIIRYIESRVENVCPDPIGLNQS